MRIHRLGADIMLMTGQSVDPALSSKMQTSIHVTIYFLVLWKSLKKGLGTKVSHVSIWADDLESIKKVLHQHTQEETVYKEGFDIQISSSILVIQHQKMQIFKYATITTIPHEKNKERTKRFIFIQADNPLLASSSLRKSLFYSTFRCISPPSLPQVKTDSWYWPSWRKE